MPQMQQPRTLFSPMKNQVPQIQLQTKQTKKGPAITDTAADHPVETAVHQLGEDNVQTAQPDTIHTASIGIDEAPNHTISIPLLMRFKNPTQHPAVTLMTCQ